MKKLTKLALLATAMVAFLGLAGCKPQSTDKSKNTNTNTNTNTNNGSGTNTDPSNSGNSGSQTPVTPEVEDDYADLCEKLYCDSDGYPMSCWACWENDNTPGTCDGVTANMTKMTDDGEYIHITNGYCVHLDTPLLYDQI